MPVRREFECLLSYPRELPRWDAPHKQVIGDFLWRSCKKVIGEGQIGSVATKHTDAVDDQMAGAGMPRLPRFLYQLLQKVHLHLAKSLPAFRCANYSASGQRLHDGRNVRIGIQE